MMPEAINVKAGERSERREAVAGARARERVCAIVITYNRKELLSECLAALLAQTRAADEIVVVNNASTDGTADLLAQAFSQVTTLNLTENVGGAGGFYEGMRWAHACEFDWVWLMDDDTIAAPDALSELLAAGDRFDRRERPEMLASKVVWTDGSLHSMNISNLKRHDPERMLLAAERATLSIRSTTFVSLLVHRDVIERHGLPVADYFIWNDDAEYTARALRDGFGVVVPTSVVTHKTARKHTTFDDAGPKFYYHVRNNLWSLLYSRAWSPREKVKEIVFFCASIANYLRRSHCAWPSLRAVGAGLRDGLLKRPGSESRAGATPSARRVSRVETPQRER
jgi:GT2 family glycosyltransferase